jgi:hypothetical protein
LLPCQFMCDIELSHVIDSLQSWQINTFVEAEKTHNFLSESSWNLKFISLQKGCVSSSSSSSNRDVWSKSDRTVTERDWLNSLRIRNPPPPFCLPQTHFWRFIVRATKGGEDMAGYFGEQQNLRLCRLIPNTSPLPLVNLPQSIHQPSHFKDRRKFSLLISLINSNICLGSPFVLQKGKLKKE